jgi:hypothetical protein
MDNKEIDMDALHEQYTACGGTEEAWPRWQQRLTSISETERDKLLTAMNMERLRRHHEDTGTVSELLYVKLAKARTTAETELREKIRSHYLFSDTSFDDDWPYIRAKLMADLIAEKMDDALSVE